jgi:hypothetical protein
VRPKNLEKTYPSATLPTTNPTWSDPSANTGLRGERPAINRLNHGMAKLTLISSRNSSSFMEHKVTLSCS